MPERFDRFESAVHVLRALWSEAAAAPPGVTRDDPFYLLAGATNEPAAPARRAAAVPGRSEAARHRPGRGRRRRLAAAGRRRAGQPVGFAYFSEKRDRILEALAAAGRDPSTFEIVAQVPTGTTADDRRWALGQGLEAVERGATSVILGMPPRLGAAGVDAVADIAVPLREALGA